MTMKKTLLLNYFSKKNMKRQLITLFVCAIMIPVLCVSGVIAFLTYKRTASHYEALTRSQVKLVHATLVSTAISLHSIYETVVSDSGLQELLCSDNDDFDYKQATGLQAAAFEETLTNTAMLNRLQLYVPADLMEHIPQNKYIIPLSEELAAARLYQKSEEIIGNFWLSDIRTGQNDVNYWELHYCCRVPIPQKSSHAVLVMSISNDYLRSLIADKNYQLYMNVNDEPVFISSDRSYAGQPFPINPESEAADSRTGIFTLFGEKVIGSLETATLYQSSDRLHILVANTDALPTVRRLFAVLILLLLSALLVSGAVILLYASYFGSRIDTLRLAMYKVSNNDYEIVDTIRGDDELTAAFHDLKIMVRKLKKAEAEIYQSQIREQTITNQQQQMELKLLAGQIHPHFLYNTLESIRMKAFAEGNREVANAIKLLSKSMRYVLGTTQATSTTLKGELDYIDTYLAIQKLRFGPRISYDIKVDESLQPARIQILPILLQPIVENAFSHGLENRAENGRIILKLYPAKDRTCLTAAVFDNGEGMSREKLSDVVCHMNTPPNDSGHGVGLYNTNNRIRLFYGEEYGITIRSKQNYGTCVTVTLPLYDNREEES